MFITFQKTVNMYERKAIQKMFNIETKTDNFFIENETPQISGNTTLYVEANKEVELKFNVSDDGKEKPTLKLLKKPDNFYLDDEANIARWTPQQSSIPEIRYV